MSAHTFCKTIHTVNTKHTCMHYCRNHTGHKTNAVDNVIYFFPYAQGNKPTKKKIPSFHEHNMNKKRTPPPPKKKENTAHKLLLLVSSPSWIWPENLIYITGDILIRQTAGKESPCMPHPPLYGCGLNLVTGLLHGLNEGYPSQGVQIVNLPPPCREKFFNWVKKW